MNAAEIYREAKAEHPDALALIRIGDFYEAFHDDAKALSGALGLTLTTQKANGVPLPMAGFPYHQLETYLKKLLASGIRVAVCGKAGA